MNDDMDDVTFPELRQAAQRLELDATAMAESLLTRLDAGEGYWHALHGVVVEAAQRRGVYGGAVKRDIDNGDAFAATSRRYLPQNPGRLAEMMEGESVDIFDALAAAGMTATKYGDAGAKEFERRRAVRLDAVRGDKEGDECA